MPNKIEYLIDTDIFVDYLTQKDDSALSDLEAAMSTGMCFTSVVQASELYFYASDPLEKHGVDSVMRAMKVLGIHPRYSLTITDFFNKVATTRDAIVCSVAKNNKLPIFTNDSYRYNESRIKIITSLELRG
ncbi:MAG: PIN domain-containing protein [Melioribacteraceae bacterium]